jgi:hypothetical protein
MLAKHVFGDGTDGVYVKPFTDTTPQVCGPVDHGDKDGVGIQLIVDYQVDKLTLTAGDGVVASTKTFTVAGVDFTGLTGAKVTFAGATNAGPYTITTPHNGSFVASGASGLVDETFDLTKVNATLQHTETAAKPAGTWTILASNNYVRSSTGTSLGAPGNPGKFTDVTALFGTVAAVTDAGSQYVQAPLHARHFEVIFTPSAGKGVATAAVFSKSWST